MLFIFTYDIVDDKRRTKLAKKLGNFGIRVQYSVFECELNAEKLQQVIKMSLEFIDLQQDSLRIYALCQRCAGETISYGIKKGLEINDVIVS